MYIGFISFHILLTLFSHYRHTICINMLYYLYIIYISHLDIIYTLFVYCVCSYMIGISFAYHLYTCISYMVYICYIKLLYTLHYLSGLIIVLFVTILHMSVLNYGELNKMSRKSKRCQKYKPSRSHTTFPRSSSHPSMPQGAVVPVAYASSGAVLGPSSDYSAGAALQAERDYHRCLLCLESSCETIAQLLAVQSSIFKAANDVWRFQAVQRGHGQNILARSWHPFRP